MISLSSLAPILLVQPATGGNLVLDESGDPLLDENNQPIIEES